MPATTMSILAPALGWVIPGAGHLLQRRWVRGFLIMASVTAMFAFGLAMDGKIYRPNAGDLLDILGFIGDLGAGGLYFLGRILNWGSEAITYAAADYGTKYIVVAGLLNIMGVVDAYHIAIGKKP
jgi:hypothetical protein